MSYADARPSRAPALAASIAINAAIGFALISGLTYTMMPRGDEIDLRLAPVHEPPPPPPIPDQPHHKASLTQSSQPIPIPKPIVPTVEQHEIVTTLTPLPPIPADPGPIKLEPTPQPQPQPTLPKSLARTLSPIGNQGDWFPYDSYPAAALAVAAEGVVSVAVDVGADGRVTGCRVTASSGNRALDETTCRLARRNGRFAPALDADGNAVAASVALRNVRWRIAE